jgi:hypothetical protein
MTAFSEAFRDCYLVQYSIEPDRTINALKALPLQYITNTKSGTPFYGVKAGPYGVRFINGATHVGIFDLSDPDNPITIHSIEYANLETRKMHLVKARNSYIVIRRGDKNFKLYVSEYKSLTDARKNAKPQPKLDPQTKKVNNSLKSLKHKKAT